MPMPMPLEPPSLPTQSTLGGLRAFNSHDGQLQYPVSDRARVEARICAGILGPGPLTFEMMVSDKWAKEVYALSHRGVSRAGFALYLASASVCAIPDPLVPAFHQATVPISRSRIEQIPNVLLDKVALKHKLPTLQKYAENFQREDLFNPNQLNIIRKHLQAEKLKYFGTEPVDVVIVVKRVRNPRIRENVSQAFNSLPAVYKSVQGKVKKEGSQYQPWEISVDGYIGSSPIKKEARMIAVVRRYLDATFDGSAPLAENAVPHMERIRDLFSSASSMSAC